MDSGPLYVPLGKYCHFIVNKLINLERKIVRRHSSQKSNIVHAQLFHRMTIFLRKLYPNSERSIALSGRNDHTPHMSQAACRHRSIGD